MVASIFHLGFSGKKIDWKNIIKTFIDDPEFAVHLVPNVMKLALKKARS